MNFFVGTAVGLMDLFVGTTVVEMDVYLAGRRTNGDESSHCRDYIINFIVRQIPSDLDICRVAQCNQNRYFKLSFILSLLRDPATLDGLCV